MTTQSLQDTLANLAQEFEMAEDPTVNTANPGDAGKVGDIVHRPTPEAPLPVAISDHQAQWVTLYNTRTGEPCAVNYYKRNDALKKVHRDKDYPEFLGKPFFFTKPLVQRVLGTHLCMLHRKHPMRGQLETMGFPVCPAAHIPSEQQVQLHMQRKHKSEWGAIQLMREQEARERSELLMLRQTEAMEALSRLGLNSAGQASPPTAPPRPPVKELDEDAKARRLAGLAKAREAKRAQREASK